MAQRLVNEARTVNRTTNKEIYINRGLSIYVNDDTDQEAPELTAEDYDDAPLEADEESEDYGDDYPEGTGAGTLQPIWVLHEGQIIWAASHYGFRLSPKEYFRRRLQILLDFLAKEFPGKNYRELLLGLKGFFAKDNDTSKGNWLESLKTAGILCMNDETSEYEMIPIGAFRVGKGQGRDSEGISRSLPKNLEYLWLDRELPKHENASGSPLDWKNCKGWLLEDIRRFCARLNDLCSSFDGEGEEGNTRGIGLKRIQFDYEESTLQRKKLGGWKKWRAER